MVTDFDKSAKIMKTRNQKKKKKKKKKVKKRKERGRKVIPIFKKQ